MVDIITGRAPPPAHTLSLSPHPSFFCLSGFSFTMPAALIGSVCLREERYRERGEAGRQRTRVRERRQNEEGGEN